MSIPCFMGYVIGSTEKKERTGMILSLFTLPHPNTEFRGSQGAHGIHLKR